MNPSPFPSTPTENYNYFLKADTSAYKGEWIAIVGKKIVAHGKDAQKVYGKAQRKYPAGRISLARAPTEQRLILFDRRSST